MIDPKSLPIRQYAQQIVDSVKANPVTVVIGETGSGKTTQISQILEEAGFADRGVIGITQPRRVAAVSVARRVAQERNVDLGTHVGYTVRFEDRTSSKTRIKYLTDGTLLREVLDDPLLRRYSVIVLDEAHERSLNTDILFGLLKHLALGKSRPLKDSQRHKITGEEAPSSSIPVSLEEQEALPALKLVVTSATLDSEKFSQFFNDCPVFNVPGRTFPVTIVHSLEDHVTDYEAAAVDTAMDVHCTQPEGDILMFLTGQAEIDRAVRALNDAVRALPPESCRDLQVIPLYAALPPEMQARAFSPAPPGVRRCVVATNIAETSVTVDGVVYVVDSGVVKQKDYNPRTGMDSLGVVPISRVQATQRAGRAGRTRPGICYRLYTEKKFEREMASATAPEIQRTSLVGATLYLKSLPLNIDVLGFDFIDPPAKESLEDALRQLYVLDAIDVDGNITPTGHSMAEMPLDPSLARALIAARDFGCLDAMMTVASMLSPEGSVFLGGKGPEQLVSDTGTSTSHGRDHLGKKGGGSGGDSYRTSTHSSTITPRGRALLEEMMADGLGDHVLLLRLYRAWEAAGSSLEWCRDIGVDGRSMRFARDVRRQLERIMTEERRKNESDDDDDTGGDKDKRIKRARRDLPGGMNEVDALRTSLTIGFSNRLARRMSMHNGYRTMGIASALAQVHPSSARLAADDDGLLPEWVVYHELVSTGRVYLSGVCSVDGQWVSEILPKLHNVDVARLSGGATTQSALEKSQAEAKAAAAAGGKNGVDAMGGTSGPERRNTDAAVEAAKARFLARKAAAAAAGGGKAKHKR